jgi:hypothetical protein
MTYINSIYCVIIEKNRKINTLFNPLNAELNPICPLLALLGDYHILHVSRLRVNHEVEYKLNLIEKKTNKMRLCSRIYY